MIAYYGLEKPQAKSNLLLKNVTAAAGNDLVYALSKGGGDLGAAV